MKKRTWFLFLAFSTIFCMYSCTKDHTALPPTVDCTGIVDTLNTFNKNIYPNITGLYCAYAPCHGGGSAQDGVDLTTYQSTVTAFKTQNFMCAVTSSNCGGVQMPTGMRPLDSATIKQLQCWQANGYPQ